MSLRMPQSLSTSPRWETGQSVLDAEFFSEKAANLGRLSRAVEPALAALRACTLDRDAPERRALLKAAADAVWCYFVQREMCGLRDHREVIAHYAVPREVLARLGAST